MSDNKELEQGKTYTLGNFRIILDEETNVLSIMVVAPNKDRVTNLMIRPVVANAINVIACK